MKPGGLGEDYDSYQPGLTTIALRWTSGATGAIASVDKTKAYGLDPTTPVARTGTGVFAVKLAESWADNLPSDIEIIQATPSTAGAWQGKVTAYSPSTKTITVSTFTAAGAAVDPTTGDVVAVGLQLQRYTKPIKAF